MAKAAAAAVTDFDAAFQQLKRLLKPFAPHLRIQEDKPGSYCLVSKENTYKGRPMYFAAVQARKNYVSFHLVPVYACPELLKGISPELKKRKQGKGCFNFVRPDAALFAELGKLAEAGLERFREKGWV